MSKILNVFKFDKDEVLIGRDSTCDLRIDNVGVSRHHARIERQGNVYLLLDLDSGNGTFVRGKRITRYNLNNGDEINIWNYSVFFKTLRPEAVETTASRVKTPKVDLDLTIAIDPVQLERKQRERASSLTAYLTYEAPPRGTQNYSLMKTTTFFGTGQKCEFKIPGWFISPRHAMIVRDEVGFRFINLATRRQGRVNEKKVDDYRLKNGDVIQIASKTFKFLFGLPSYR